MSNAVASMSKQLETFSAALVVSCVSDLHVVLFFV